MEKQEKLFYTDIKKFIEKGIIDTTNIFSLKESQKQLFKEKWTEIVLTEIIEGKSYASIKDINAYGYTSAKEVPTENISKALKESNISLSGKLPEGKSYKSEMMIMTEELQRQAKDLYKERNKNKKIKRLIK